MNFSAVILAGGKSSRMGRDKALLEAGGQTLLARQIQTVREVGARDIFISGPAGADYAGYGCPVIEDKFPEAGPLAGIERALAAANHPLLLVLAVDMPHMSSELLKQISTHCHDGVGAVPLVDGRIEPLAAFYPKAAESLILNIFMDRDPLRSPGAKYFAEQCVQAGLVRLVNTPPDEAGFFKSWNSPADLPKDAAAPWPSNDPSTRLSLFRREKL